MNNDAAAEGRPRPLSSGLWTLFSWLRRDDRSASSDSLSSAGSDRTVASFAFLSPAHYPTKTGPLILPPPGSPTDSYKKRVYDRNLRRNRERDITLHRKYGLLKSEGTSSYDAFSLPQLRRINGESGSRWDRDRRATSECYQRRLAHVPGKRRAPLPPTSSTLSGGPSSLTRRSTRKRRAPQPPVKQFETNKQYIKKGEVNTVVTQMNSKTYQDDPKSRNNHVTMGCKSEKYCKKEESPKDSKVKSEKSFLKQIFDSKKRNSTVDTASVSVLPSISELDKQAAEIIETCKLKAAEKNNNITPERIASQSSNQADSWFCIRCLRKYNSTVVTCLYCLPNQRVHSSVKVKNEIDGTSEASNRYTTTANKFSQESDDKQKLKDMLKEMKDSLPKRPKHDVINKNEPKMIMGLDSGRRPYSTEMPTLRVGSSLQDAKKACLSSQPSTSNNVLEPEPEAKASTSKSNPHAAQSALVAQVISAYKKDVNRSLKLAENLANENKCATPGPVAEISVEPKVPKDLLHKKTNDSSKDKKALHTPLKISSLLNPVYVPKNPTLDKQFSKDIIQPEPKNNKTDKVDILKVNRVSKNAGVQGVSSDLAIPSTSQMIVNDEIKHKNHNTKSTKEEQTLLQNNSPHVLPEDKYDFENKVNNTNMSKLPILAKEQIFLSSTDILNQHSRRRDLINQLEKSIAKGDERAAAEAAAKLAQLRLSCSVLSFSSQILSQPSSSSANNVTVPANGVEPNNNKGLEASIPVKAKFPPKVSERKVAQSVVQKIENISTNIGTPNALSNQKEKLPKTTPEHDKRQAAFNPNRGDNNLISIAVLVEDREATRGPIHLSINRQALMKDLRREAETALGLATNLQRWIIGRALCVDDNSPIISLAGPDFSAPFYLCVVDSEMKIETVTQQNHIVANNDTQNLQKKAGNVYTELVQLEQQALVPNAEVFECGVCIEEYPPGQGVVLRECVHIFCKECLADVVRHCEEPDIPCPAMGCRGMLQEREIRALVSPHDYERWLARGLAAAESGTRNAFHCRTRDCKGWALCEPGVRRFPCPVCKCINCVPCQAIHPGETCEQHRAKVSQANGKNTASNETDDGTRTLLNSLIRKGEALECPECSAIITKKWGCDWVKCSACKTEICWVTRGRRWGPGGKGDTSGGCRCGVDGKRCHPSCGYCH